jgi:serine/threonine-protein kinase RsbT
MAANEARVPIASDTDIVAARSQGRTLAIELGFPSGDITLIATAISELARNILSYARQGEILIKAINGSNHAGILIVASDKGPGISDLRQALRDGFSTSGSLGLGLPGVRRLMDEFEITSEPMHGTTVKVKKWKQRT